jgi:hypothetical protein
MRVLLLKSYNQTLIRNEGRDAGPTDASRRSGHGGPYCCDQWPDWNGTVSENRLKRHFDALTIPVAPVRADQWNL